MTIRIVREPSIDGATLSVWFVDGHFECFGLEDQIRDVKVAGATAIDRPAANSATSSVVRIDAPPQRVRGVRQADLVDRFDEV